MKPVWDESVVGRDHFWMKVSWMKLSAVLDEMVLDESVFGRECFWMSFFFSNLDESVPTDAARVTIGRKVASKKCVRNTRVKSSRKRSKVT